MRRVDSANLNHILSFVKRVDDNEFLDRSLFSLLQQKMVVVPGIGRLVDKDSLGGRIACRLFTPTESRLKNVVKRALDLEWQREGLSPVGQWEVYRLHRDLKTGRPGEAERVDTGRPSLEIEAGEDEVSWTADPETLRSLSLLSGVAGEPVGDINRDLLRAVFDLGNHHADRVAFLHYLQDRISGIVGQVTSGDLADRVEEGMSFERLLNDIVSQGSRNSTRCLAIPRLREMAESLADRVATMDSGCSFFCQCDNSSVLRQHFVDGITKLLPDQASHVLQRGDFDGIVDQFVGGLTGGIDEVASGLDILSEREWSIVRTIFERGFVGSVVPDRVRRWIPNFLERVFIPSVLRVSFKDEAFAGITEEENKVFAEELYQKITQDGLGEALKRVVQDKASGIKGQHKAPLIDLADGIFAGVPDIGKQLLSACGITEPILPFWFDIDRQPDGKYTVQVYSSGTGLSHHPMRGGLNKHIFPLKYVDVDGSQLNKEFFFRILSPMAWSQWDEKTSYNVRNLYTLLNSLGEPVDSGIVDSGDVKGFGGLSQAFVMSHIDPSMFDQLPKIGFELRKKALLDMWSHVKADDQLLKRDSQLRDSLMASAQKLNDEGMALYRKGVLTLDQMKEVYSTVWDVEQYISAARPKEAAVLSPAGKNSLRMVLQCFGGVKDYAFILKDVMVGAFGEDMQDTIDLAIAEVVGEAELDATTNVVPAESLPEGWSVRAVLRNIVNWVKAHADDICWVVVYSGFQALTLGMGGVGSIALYILTSTLWCYRNHLLRQVLPKEWFEKYEQLYNLLRSTVITNVVKLLVKAFISKERIAQVNVKARALQQRIARSGTLGFHLHGERGVLAKATVIHDGHIFAYNGDVDDLVIEDRTRVACLEDFRRRHFSFHEAMRHTALAPGLIQTAVSVAARQTYIPDLELPGIAERRCVVGGLLAGFDIERPPILPVPSSSQLIRHLRYYLTIHSNMKVRHVGDLQRAEYIINVVRSLSVPDKGAAGYWDEVRDVEGCMEAVVDLSKALGEGLLPLNLQQQAIVASYHLLAITDYLARRCPEAHLDDFAINGFDFLYWATGNGCVIEDKACADHMMSVAAYFGVDLSKQYTFEEIKSLSGESLFSLSWAKGDGSGRFLAKRYDFTGSLEGKYYLRLLDDPIVKAKVDSLAEAGASIFDKMFIVLKDGSGEDYVLPRSVYWLRMMCYLTRSRLSSHRYLFPSLASRRDHFDVMEQEVEHSSWEWLKKLERFLGVDQHSFHMRLGGFNACGLTLRQLPAPLTSFCRSCDESSPSFVLGHSPEVPWSYYRNSSRDRSENRVVIESDDGTRALFAIMALKREDQIVRAFAFFEQYLNQLSNTDLRIVFESLILHGDALKQQLEAAPEFGGRIGLFFNKALKFHLAQKDTLTVLSLIRLAIVTRNYCSPEMADTFPDLSVLLQKISVENINGPYFSRIQALRVFNYYHLSPGEVPPEERLKIAAELMECWGTLFPTSSYLKIQHRVLSTIDRWKDVIIRDLDGAPKIRDRALCAIASANGYGPDIIAVDSKWTGCFPHYNCGPLGIGITSNSCGCIHHEDGNTKIRCYLNDVVAPALGVDRLHLELNEAREFVVPSEGLVVEETIDDELAIVRIFTEFEGRRYQFITPGDITFDESITAGSTHCWLEQHPSDDGIQQLHVMKKKTLQAIVYLRKNDGGGYDVIATTKDVDGEMLEEVDLSTVTHSLNLLEWFYPFDQVSVYRTYERPDVIHSISVPGINFDVREVEGELRACPRDILPGYYVGVQGDPSFRQYPRHLILQKSGSDMRKVIVGIDDINASVISPAVRSLPMMPQFSLLDHHIDSIVQSSMSSEKCYYIVYDVVKKIDRDDEFRLTSTDPSALAYLLAYHFASRNQEEVIYYLTQLEAKGRLQPFDKETLQFINRVILLSLATQSPENRLLAIRLAVISEENILLHPTDAADEKDEASIILLNWFNVQFQYSMYLRNRERGLTKYQELFVLTSICRNGGTVIKFFAKDIYEEIHSYMVTLGADSVVENMFMMPQLADRWRVLRRESGEEFAFVESLYQKTFDGSFHDGVFALVDHSEKALGAVDRAIAKVTSPVTALTSRFMPRVPALDMNTTMETILDVVASPLKRQFDVKELARRLQSGVYRALPNKDFGMRDSVSSLRIRYARGVHLCADRMVYLPFDIFRLNSGHIARYFFDYYAFAREELPEVAKEDPAKRAVFERRVAEFKAFIPLARGLFDSEINMLVEYLYVVSKAPNRKVPVPFSLSKNSLPKVVDFFCFPGSVFLLSSDKEYCSCLTRLHNAVLMDAGMGALHKGGGAVSRLAAKNIAYKVALTAGSRFLRRRIKGPNLGFVSMGMSVAQMGIMGTRWLAAMHSASKDSVTVSSAARTMTKARRPEEKSLSDEWCFRLQERDQLLGSFITTIRDKYFVITPIERDDPTAAQEARIALFDYSDADEQVVKDSFLELQQSMRDYYARPDRVDDFTVDFIDGTTSVDELQYDLQRFVERRGEVLQGRLAEILAFANQHKPHVVGTDVEELYYAFGQRKAPKKDISERQLFRLFLMDDVESYARLTELNETDIKALHLALYDYLLESTRCQQAQRAIKLLDKLRRSDPDSIERGIILRQLYGELSASRKYTFDLESSRLLRSFMMFEYSSGIILWQRQVDQISRMLLAGEGQRRLVLELIMGSGKTFWGMPEADFMAADGQQLVINVWPSSLARTNTATVAEQADTVFGQDAYALHFSRDKMTRYQFIALNRLFKHCIAESCQCNLTRGDAQTLELNFIELLDTYDQGLDKLSRKERADVERSIDFSGLALTTIRKKGRFNIDEVHEILYCRQELNHPSGTARTIDSYLVEVVSRIMGDLVGVSFIEAIAQVRENNQNKLTPFEYKAIADALVTPGLLISIFDCDHVELRELKDYVLDSKLPTPPFMLRPGFSSQSRERIDLLRGLLTKLLPRIFLGKVGVDYGPSDDPTIEYAVPYDGNNTPKKKSTIRNPYEAIIKTFIMMLQMGLNRHQCELLFTRLHNKAKREKSRKYGTIPLSQTPSGKFFIKVCGMDIHEEFCDPFEMAQHDIDAVYIAMAQHHDAIIMYTQDFIVPTIKYYEENICSNAQNFAAMCAAFYAVTGTPFNRGTYPVGTEVLQDPGTIGETVDVLLDKCAGDDAIEVLTQDKPREVLDEILAAHFAAGSKRTALIDRGALFHGLTNEEVAERMIEYIRRHRPELQGLSFFSSSGEQMIWHKDVAAPVSYSIGAAIPRHALAAYFDHVRTFGANILLGLLAEGIVTIGKTITLEGQLSQAVWRMRYLDPKKGQQGLVLVMTESTRQAIVPEGMPSVQQIIAYASRNESRSSLEDNYFTAGNQLANVVRRAVLDEILEAPNIGKMLKIFREFRNVLITTTEVNPTILYGGEETMEPPREALDRLVEMYRTRVSRSRSLSRRIKMKVSRKLSEVGGRPYPERVSTRPKEIEGTQELDANQSADRDQVQEQQQDQDQNQAVTTIVPKKWQLSPPSLFDWNTCLDITTTQWLRTQRPSSTSIVMAAIRNVGDLMPARIDRLHGKHECRVPLYSLRDILVARGNAIMSAAARSFDRNIICTNNFLPIMARGLCEGTVTPCSDDQNPVLEVLVIAERDVPGFKIVVVDAHDAVYWRRKLAFSGGMNPDIRMALYDVGLSSVVCTSREASLCTIELHSDQIFNQLEVQLKFFNGDTRYDERQKTALRAWLKGCSWIHMERLFKFIHDQRGITEYNESDIEGVFEEIKAQSSFDDLTLAHGSIVPARSLSRRVSLTSPSFTLGGVALVPFVKPPIGFQSLIYPPPIHVYRQLQRASTKPTISAATMTKLASIHYLLQFPWVRESLQRRQAKPLEARLCSLSHMAMYPAAVSVFYGIGVKAYKSMVSLNKPA